MSVPARYSAAANYAVADGGLTNTLNQEEQYHHHHHHHPHHQQQQQQQQRELYCQMFGHKHGDNNNDSDSNGNNCVLVEQQAMSSVEPENLAGLAGVAIAVAAMEQEQEQVEVEATVLAQTSELLLDAEMEPTSAAAAAAVATAAAAVASEAEAAAAAAAVAAATVNTASNGKNGNAEMRTDWGMSEGGRYGTPGAAGLDYQKYEMEQQQQQQQQQRQLQNSLANNMNQPMEPLVMDTGKNMNSNSNTNNNNGFNQNHQKNWEEELRNVSSESLCNTLKEYDALQDKYHTVLLLPKESKREVTAGGRDGSAYVLRCLKMWYELPSDVLFSAISLVDRFLDRMTVKPKHMACMSVASFYLAIKQLNLKAMPAEDLVTISQCGCTAGDLERMAGVIANKLGVQMGHTPVTSVSFLRIYYALFRNLAKEIGGEFHEFYERFIKLEELENRLEILLCDVKTTVITPSVLALVLVSLHLDFHIKGSYTRGRPELKVVFEYILFLQQFMRIPDRVFTCGFSIVAGILSHYNGQNKQPYKQRLVWKLSTRTLRVLRPTNRFSSDLPTIEESISNAMDDGCRSRTESISSEEEEDWPTSPIIPIFEQC